MIIVARFLYAVVSCLLLGESADHGGVASLCFQNVHTACEGANVHGRVQRTAIRSQVISFYHTALHIDDL
jgi:hypothetical protein